jgi:predicted nucleotide-binding protein (sugar kinase/HSP70/actin superfamily)
MEEKGRIGIPKALMYYRYFPLWYTFFEELGWRVIVSDGLGKKGRIIYFEDSCLPMKLLVTHAVSLKGKVDHLFVPRLVSLHRAYIMCPKFRGAPDIVRLAVEGNLSIIDEMIDLRTRGYSILQSFLKIGEKLGASKKESKQAFLKAEQSYSTFKKTWTDRINRLPLRHLFQLDIPTPSIKNISPPLVGGDEGEGDLYSSTSTSTLWSREAYSTGQALPHQRGRENIMNNRLRVAFVGHPYNLFDIDLNKDILTLTKNLGVEIVTPDLLSEKEIDRQISDLSKEIYWSSGREIVGALFHFLSGGVDGVIFLTSFKCGIDALLQEFIKRRLKVRGRTSIPLLILSFDEHTGREGLITRLEAFRDVMESKKELRNNDGKTVRSGTAPYNNNIT